MKIYITFLFLFIIAQASAQVGIDNPIPDSSSVLDLKSTSKGFLIPRMTTTQRNNIFPDYNSRSLMIYDTDLKKYVFWSAYNNEWAILNPWYSEDDGKIHLGSTNQGFKVNFAPTGGSNILRISTAFNNQNGDTNAFQTTFTFKDYLVSTSGVMFNAKVSGGSFVLMRAFYNGNSVMTVKNNGNFGLGYSNPSKKLEVSGEVKVSGDLTAGSFTGNGMAPMGSIVMWSGSISSIPTGWALCDGNNGTPNLKDRFIVSVGNTYSVGNTGGANSVSLTFNQIPSHNHTGSTNSDGNHYHKVVRNQTDNGGSRSIAWYSDEGNYEEYDLFSHSNTANWGKTNSTGNHSHSFTTSNTGGGQSHENRPEFYALAFIMRIQ